MGCGSVREKLEDQMMVYKLERMEIQMEKEKELKKLSDIEGHAIERYQVPDYIDPQFAKEKRLYIEQKENKENQNNNTIESKKKKKNKRMIVKKGTKKSKN